jgi:hypothetical protein
MVEVVGDCGLVVMKAGQDDNSGERWCRSVGFDGGSNGGAFLHCLFYHRKGAQMKLLTIVLGLALSTTVFAQRNTGVTRPDADRGASSGGGRPPRTESQATENPAPQPAPQPVPQPALRPNPTGGGGPVVVCGPSLPPIIVIESPVIIEEEYEVLEATLMSGEGFDFSTEEILDAGDNRADVTFSSADEGAEFFVGSDSDVQIVGDVSFERLDSPPSDWSATRRVKAEAKNVYVVWTWDNQFYKFRVVSLGDKRVVIEWEQLDEGRKRAAREDRRNGNVRFLEKEVTFGR